MEYKLHEVISREDIRKFLDLPDTINKNDHSWIRPLDNDIEAVFNPSKNKLFNDGEAIRWIVFDENHVVVGRIAAFYSNEQAQKENVLTGGCGFFDAVNSQEVANILFSAARNWLETKGMLAMDGSINFGDRMAWWGVLVDGFHSPSYAMNYNQSYYKELFENYGFQVYFNQYTYRKDLNEYNHLSDALYAKAQRLFENKDYHFTTFDMKNMDKMTNDFMVVYNSGWAVHEGVKPITLDHAKDIVNTMKPIIDPKAIIFGYYKGQPIGFFVVVPDLNPLLGSFNGKFGPLNKLKMFWRLKRKIANRLTGLVFGVHKDFQGKGVEAGLIKCFEDQIFAAKASGIEQYSILEMQWIGDFNPVMMRMIETYVKGYKYKHHVTYRYLFDRTAPFERCPRLGEKKTGYIQAKFKL